MIKYGLKLWSSNESWFAEAVSVIRPGAFDFIELYHDTRVTYNLTQLEILRSVPVRGIHNTHDHGWHEFFVKDKTHQEQWQRTVALADFFNSEAIVVHPSRDHVVTSFLDNLSLVNDSRIIVENMAGRDIDQALMQCGQTLDDLVIIKGYKPICFDLEKAVKAAVQQGCDPQQFISQCLAQLAPRYFHISGGDLGPVDQHWNLWEAKFDMRWIKQTLVEYAAQHDILVVFETPKIGETLENDLKNLNYFKEL